MPKPDKLKMHSPDLTQENIARIRELFPDCVTEARDEKTGELRLKVDFDLLRQELSDELVEGPTERYRLDWPGKRAALLAANAPIAKTLRPCREESVNFDTTRNLFIEGDNLDALKLLQEAYLGKVKMIYIDPPYNTGKDFVYKDNFAEKAEDYLRRSNQKDEEGRKTKSDEDNIGRFHSNWLSMMYPRLKLARNLLREDGVIIIHIDEHEYSNLEKILNEIFGTSNNLGTIVWDKRNPKGDAKGIAYQHEYVIFFAKNKTYFNRSCRLKRKKENAEVILKKAQDLIEKAGGVNDEVREEFKKWIEGSNFSGGEKAYCLIDENGDVYQSVSMAWPNKKKAPDEYFTPLIHPITGKPCPVPARGWRNPPETMKTLQESGLIVFGKDESVQPRRKYFLKDNIYENVPSVLYYGGSDDLLFEEMGIKFDNPKALYVSKKLISSVIGGDNVDDIIMDFFAGSATTAHAVMQLNAEDGGNRRFIMVQLPEPTPEGSEARKAGFETIADIAKERIRRAGKKILEGECHPDWNRDIGFRVLKVDTSNMKDVYYFPKDIDQARLDDLVDNIKPDRTAEDLLFQVLIDWAVEPTLPIERREIQGKEVFFVNEEPYDLIACFDTGITEELVKELAAYKPLRVVFRDSGLADDALKTNIEQIFRQLSPSTDVKVI